jgi:hypothetical protein
MTYVVETHHSFIFVFKIRNATSNALEELSTLSLCPRPPLFFIP